LLGPFFRIDVECDREQAGKWRASAHEGSLYGQGGAPFVVCKRGRARRRASLEATRPRQPYV
jgi:hypothetical protein